MAKARILAPWVGKEEKSAIYYCVSRVVWNPIAEFSGNILTICYTWGMDLSGTMQGAGGVGGLLSVNDGSASYYPTYDGNGNISEYLDASGAVVAHYEYDAFGRTVVQSGAKANDFSHQFSTKQLDAETGLHYYGYRYYDSSNGRWPSRDPLGEIGHETVKLHIDHEEFTYQQELKTDLAFYGATIQSRIQQANNDDLSEDELYELQDDMKFMIQASNYLKVKSPGGASAIGGDYLFVSNSPISIFDVIGEDKYIPDIHKHGGSHVDRYDKYGENQGRYRPDGTGIPHKGKNPPKIPKKDIPLFEKAAKKFTIALRLF